jgi:hypothetical protein
MIVNGFQCFVLIFDMFYYVNPMSYKSTPHVLLVVVKGIYERCACFLLSFYILFLSILLSSADKSHLWFPLYSFFSVTDVFQVYASFKFNILFHFT